VRSIGADDEIERAWWRAIEPDVDAGIGRCELATPSANHVLDVVLRRFVQDPREVSALRSRPPDSFWIDCRSMRAISRSDAFTKRMPRPRIPRGAHSSRETHPLDHLDGLHTHVDAVAAVASCAARSTP